MLDTASRIPRLPVVLTPMLGREREVAALRGLMRDPATRLVTITGPGGVGKTRLAIGAMSSADGDLEIVFVPLAATREPERILPAISQALGLTPGPQEEREPDLYAALGGRRTIVVLDNLEQIPGAAPVISRLLQQVPGVTILATSQVAVETPEEHLFPLGPLETQDPTGPGTLAADAVTLFLDRARGVDPMFQADADTLEVIVDICRRLDGLPLAIELAAARANLLSPHTVRERLDDRFAMLSSRRGDLDERHRTLRTAIAWTYDLLDATEQALFRRVSVFTGGVPLDGAEAVFVPADDRSVVEVLERLVHRNMLQRVAVQDGTMRYLILESLREFGLDQLTAMREADDARLAHARWVAALAEEAEPHLGGPEQASWSSRLDRDIENIRSAVAWSLDRDRCDVVLRVAGALWPYVRERGMVMDARQWLRRALDRPGPGAAPYRAKALNAAGHLAHDHRDLDEALACFEQAQSLASAMGDVEQEINALYGLGHVASGKARFAESADLNARGRELATRINHRRLTATGESNLGLTAYYQGKAQEAIQHWSAAAMALKELEDASGEALMLSNIGAASILTGDIALAEESTLRAIGLQRQLRTRVRLLSSLNNLGLIHMLQEQFDDARAVLTEALTMYREDGNVSGQSHVTHSMANVELEDGNIERAAALFLESLGLVMDTGDVSGIIHYVHLLISICSANGDHAEAVTMLAAASRLQQEADYDLSDDDREHIERAVASARASLDEPAFHDYWSRGSVMGPDEVLRRMPIIARGIVGRRVVEPAIDWSAVASPPEIALAPDYQLTSREHDVLRLLSGSRSTQEIATALGISPRTVSTHVANLMAKMEVTSRTAAVARALRDGVIPRET